MKGYILSLALCGAESCSIRGDGRTDITKQIVAIGIRLAKQIPKMDEPRSKTRTNLAALQRSVVLYQIRVVWELWLR
jgi:hypothetical protein